MQILQEQKYNFYINYRSQKSFSETHEKFFRKKSKYFLWKADIKEKYGTYFTNEKQISSEQIGDQTVHKHVKTKPTTLSNRS
jgi:hypothetical protein